jgi:hypothetical protein
MPVYSSRMEFFSMGSVPTRTCAETVAATKSPEMMVKNLFDIKRIIGL